jgi:hypothetical protein
MENFGKTLKIHHPLSYFAFEYRRAFDKYLFGLYYLIMKRNDFDKKKAFENASTLKKLISTVYSETYGKEMFQKDYNSIESIKKQNNKRNKIMGIISTFDQ